ncbi:MAG: SMP-30/gluconolactonase/LRE family protein [Pseudomonadota bacterium]
MKLHDSRACALGEGSLWHPERQTLYWFDILGKKMLGQSETGPQEWQFDEHVSAAGWIDAERVLVASETGLWEFNLATGARARVAELEAQNPVTRSNDGRADPWGGFWIGTMGKNAEAGAGAIYRYYRGALQQLYAKAHIPNAICFAPDRSCAYFTGLEDGLVMRQPLEPADGWPAGAPEIFLDLRGAAGEPDGAVTDASGTFWIARWGGACVSAFAPDGTHLRDIALPAAQITCPAFGGPALRDLYVTSATDGLAQPSGFEHDGRTFLLEGLAQGLPEPRVIL